MTSRPAPFSPSLRVKKRDYTNPVAVARCFEACDELPRLIVAACVGRHEHRRLLFTLPLLSKRFAELVEEELKRWCFEYEGLKKLLTTAWVEQDRREYHRINLKMERVFTAALTNEHELFKMAGTLSLYSPKNYKHIANHTCCICGWHMKLKEKAPFGCGAKRPWFVFSCHRCEHDWLQRVSSDAVPEEYGMSANQVINFNPGSRADQLQAVFAYWGGFKAKDALMKGTSPLTLLINKCSAKSSDGRIFDGEPPSGLVRWVSPVAGLVRWEDTIYGAAPITKDDIASAVEKAQARAFAVCRAAQKQEESRRQRQEEAISNRRAQLTLQFAMSKIPWNSAKVMQQWHADLPDAVGYSDFVDYNTGTAVSVMRRAAFIADVLFTRPGMQYKFKQSTIEFFISKQQFADREADLQLMPKPQDAWAFRGYEWQTACQTIRRIAWLVDRFDTMRFCLEVKSRKEHPPHNEDAGTSKHLPVLLGKWTLTRFVASIGWGGAMYDSTSHYFSLSDDDLFRMRSLAGLEDEVALERLLDGPENPDARLLASEVSVLLGALLGTSHRSEMMKHMRLHVAVEDLLSNELKYGNDSAYDGVLDEYRNDEINVEYQED